MKLYAPSKEFSITLSYDKLFLLTENIKSSIQTFTWYRIPNLELHSMKIA